MIDRIGREPDLELGLPEGEHPDAGPSASYVTRLSTWLTAVTTSRNIVQDGAGPQIEAERQALAEERHILEAERLEFARLAASERQRLATEDRRLAAESQRLAADRRALADERAEFERHREAERRQAEAQDAIDHRAFVERMQAVSETARQQRDEHHLDDGLFNAALAEFDTSLETLAQLTPASEGYRSAKDAVRRTSTELAQALHRGLTFLLASLGDETSKAQLAATQAQNQIFKEQLRLGRQSVVAAIIGVVLTAIYMVFTGVNYGTGTAVNLNALKQS
jgi:hypothetical protein